MLPLPTLLLLGGAIVGVVLAVISRFAARVGGRRRAESVRRRLRDAVGTAADEVVLAPVNAELDRLRSFVAAARVAKG
jgi:hypothetical protein